MSELGDGEREVYALALLVMLVLMGAARWLMGPLADAWQADLVPGLVAASYVLGGYMVLRLGRLGRDEDDDDEDDDDDRVDDGDGGGGIRLTAPTWRREPVGAAGELRC